MVFFFVFEIFDKEILEWRDTGLTEGLEIGGKGDEGPTVCRETFF